VGGAGCEKTFGQNDAKLGACFVKGMRPGLRVLTPSWEHGIAAVAVGQNTPCKAAIHRYVLASRTMQAANLEFLDGHQHTALSGVLAGLKAPPYSTIRSANTAARVHAERVCG